MRFLSRRERNPTNPQQIRGCAVEGKQSTCLHLTTTWTHICATASPNLAKSDIDFSPGANENSLVSSAIAKTKEDFKSVRVRRHTTPVT